MGIHSELQSKERKTTPHPPRKIEITPIVLKSVSSVETAMMRSVTMLKKNRPRREKKVELLLSGWLVRTKKLVHEM